MNYDIAIIWAWPAGCSCAIMLQQYWYNVAVFDRDTFPKHNIWESLLPIVNSDYMKVIWLDEKIKKMWFPKKYGTTFVWWKNRKPWSLFFDKKLESEQESYWEEEASNILSWNNTHSYQVNRYYFDQLFIDRAREVWVQVFENSAIWKIDIVNKNINSISLKNWEKINAKFYVDASWQIAKIANSLWERKFNEDLWFSATYTYYKWAKFKDNFLTKNTQYVVSIDIWWIWFIHIWNDITSIWLVSDKKNITNEEFLEILNNTDEISDLIANAHIVDSLWNKSTQIYKARNRSYFNESLYGNNYLCVWDAAWFVDPILSWGLSLALMSGITSSAYIDNYLKNWDVSRLKLYEKTIFEDINNYYKLAKYWYAHNKSMNSWFWQAKSILWFEISNTYNKRAFTFLASGWYYTKKNFDAFNEVRIDNFAYNFEDLDEINHLIDHSEKHINFIDLFKNIHKYWWIKQYEESIKILWLQVKILEKKIWEVNNEFWNILSFWIKNLSKIQLFQFIFIQKNFSILLGITQWKINNIEEIKNKILSEFIFQYKFNEQNFIHWKISVSCNIESNIILTNGIVLRINSWKINHIEIGNNRLFINKKLILKKYIICNVDNFIW
jgi:clorobiocin biosynthesis protein Clo-hal